MYFVIIFLFFIGTIINVILEQSKTLKKRKLKNKIKLNNDYLNQY